MNNYSIIELLKKDYLDVEEQMYLEDRCEFLFAVWRDIILCNSSRRISNIDNNIRSILLEALEQIDIYLVEVNDVSISALDKRVVTILLRVAVKLKRISIVDFVFKRTKSSAKAMPQYFYPELIINAYIGLLEIEKAKQILNFIFDIDHKSYWYRIIDMNLEKYKEYPSYLKELRSLRHQCIVKLLKTGETVNLDLDLQIFNELSQYI